MDQIFAAIFKGKSIGFRIDFDDAFLSIVGPLQQRHTDGGLPLTSGLPLASGLLRRGNDEVTRWVGGFVPH